ncbi:MAG: IS1182 family transposase [Bacteroidota bacterium]
MSKTYRPYEPDQMFLMPPSLIDWLPKEHMVFFLREVLEKIDLSPITSVYEREERGYPPYHPKMMTGILMYGYANGIWSSRKLAKRCQEDVAFRVLAANNGPDFRTISEFRRRHLESLKHLFAEVLTLCRKAGLVHFGNIALDGTKVKANASKHKAMSYLRMQQEQSRLEQEIARLMKEADRTDKREDKKYGPDKRGDELPEELVHRETRLARILEAKRALEEEARRNKDDDPPAGPPMAKAKSVKDPRTGKQTPPDRAQRNFTDPDSRIMPYQKTFIQGYNAQVAVDSGHQIIVATDVSNSPTDESQLKYMVRQLPRKPRVFTADAGYASTENLAYLKKRRIDAYIACSRERHGLPDGPPPRGRIPSGLTLRDLMRRKVRTLKGRRVYARRKAIVEPPIGQIKHALGFRQFNLRGHPKVRAEWFLVSTVHNLRKLFKACLQDPERRNLILAT